MQTINREYRTSFVFTSDSQIRPSQVQQINECSQGSTHSPSIRFIHAFPTKDGIIQGVIINTCVLSTSSNAMLMFLGINKALVVLDC